MCCDLEAPQWNHQRWYRKWTFRPIPAGCCLRDDSDAGVSSTACAKPEDMLFILRTHQLTSVSQGSILQHPATKPADFRAAWHVVKIFRGAVQVRFARIPLCMQPPVSLGSPNGVQWWAKAVGHDGEMQLGRCADTCCRVFKAAETSMRHLSVMQAGNWIWAKNVKI